MAPLAFQASVFLDTSKLRSGSSSLPYPDSDICFAVSQPTPPGVGHAEHHPQSRLSTRTRRSTAELGQWIQYTSLDVDHGTNCRL